MCRGWTTISGIIHVIGQALQWRDTLPAYGPHRTLNNRFACRNGIGYTLPSTTQAEAP
jgi:hypothetical protein